jgi:hypothetical protein
MVEDRSIHMSREARELAEGFMAVALSLARAVHDIDPRAAERMNFSAGLTYNRLLDEDKPLAADFVYRFGRALVDHDLFPPAEEIDREDD